MPPARIILYSPHNYFCTHKDDKLDLSWDETTLRLPKSSTTLSLLYHPASNISRMVVPLSDSSNHRYLVVEAEFSQSMYNLAALRTYFKHASMVESITPDNTTVN